MQERRRGGATDRRQPVAQRPRADAWPPGCIEPAL